MGQGMILHGGFDEDYFFIGEGPFVREEWGLFIKVGEKFQFLGSYKKKRVAKKIAKFKAGRYNIRVWVEKIWVNTKENERSRTTYANQQGLQTGLAEKVSEFLERTIGPAQETKEESGELRDTTRPRLSGEAEGERSDLQEEKGPLYKYEFPDEADAYDPRVLEHARGRVTGGTYKFAGKTYNWDECPDGSTRDPSTGNCIQDNVTRAKETPHNS